MTGKMPHDGGRFREVAVIPGGGGGLGREVAVGLARRGVAVVVGGRTLSSLEETVQAVNDAGGDALAVVGDAGRESDVEELFRRTSETFGPCTILVHAAALHGTPMPLVDVSAEEWQRVYGSNLFATFLTSRAALRAMIPAERGALVFCSSPGVLRGFARAAPYAAMKSALLGYARTLAAEVGPYGIRVNVLTPGAMTTTAVFRESMAGIGEGMGLSEDEMMAALHDMAALRRPTGTDEVARAAVFLALDATATTGQNLVADAGLAN